MIRDNVTYVPSPQHVLFIKKWLTVCLSLCLLEILPMYTTTTNYAFISYLMRYEFPNGLHWL